MKTNPIFFSLISVSLFFACTEQPLERLEPEKKPQEGINIKINDAFIFHNDAIDYYDQSAHLFYMKDNLDDSIGNYYDANYWITDGDDVLLSGTYDSYCSCFYLHYREPKTQLVDTWVYGAPYLLLLDFKNSYDSLYFSYEDTRNNTDFLNALAENGKLRKGLMGEIDDIDFIASTEVSVTIKVANYDSINYYIPDPEKMSSKYYHSLTSGLMLVDSSNDRKFANIRDESLNSFASFDTNWLTLIKSDETIYFTVNYTGFDTLTAGKYKAFFQLPGIWNGIVPEKKDLILDNGTIWLGFSELSKEVEL